MVEEKVELRKILQGEHQAREDLGSIRTQPAWLERAVALPFGSLSPDEFEIFCYLLLLKEQAPGNQEVFYYGKTSDAGRDIIRVFTDRRIELIQCKHSRNNAGIGPIRKELAKVFVNVFTGKIPGPKPDLITFYVSSDLTAHALDLLRFQILWQASAPKAIMAHLGSSPSVELLRFAREWWPRIAPETGLTLSERAKAVGGLIDEFFTVKKVVDASALVPLDQKLDQLIQQQTMGAPSQMLGYLARLDALNPGLSFSVGVSHETTEFTAEFKPGIEQFDVGQLMFPGTEDGKRGLQKFRQHLDEGKDVELLPGEAEWRTALRLPGINLNREESHIKVSKKVTAKELPVRIECLENDKCIASIPFAKMKLQRKGRGEREYVFSSGQLAGRIHLVLADKKDRGGRFHVEFDPASVTAENALKTVDLLLAANPTARVEIIHLEDEKLILDLWGFNESFDKALFGRTRTFLAHLCIINRALDLGLRYPEKPGAHDQWLAEVMAAGITSGGIVFPTPGFAVNMDLTKDALQEMVDGWSAKKPVHLTIANMVAPPLAGQQLPPIEWVVHFGPLKAPCPLDKLAELAEHVSPEALTHLVLECEQVFHRFPRWDHPPDTNEERSP